MHSEGFLDTRTKGSKTGLAIVIAGHAAAIIALALVKTQVIGPPNIVRTQIYETPADPTPPEIPPPPRTGRDMPSATMPTIIDLPPLSQTAILTKPIDPPSSGVTDVVIPTQPVIAEPAFVEAKMDPAAAGRFQPDYPAAMARAGTEGFATVRILIGADGRVRQVVQVNATDPTFFTATERQALRYWRFRAATRDGVATESWRTLTVRFKLVE
ncbi:energy transducer TonB [Sphingomonas montanisoli]|uniref:Energy transducer TonB n=1 Tax=Sphingomonas montanisoli TaxID=2606412 RepID=A0A5D9C5U6_9SPHN|nr:energy transducer TonB [Sphingomonas montanisoli]TZG27174.1 energy transducer TonB [Sphingomonas montanisoli]